MWPAVATLSLLPQVKKKHESTGSAFASWGLWYHKLT